MLELIFKVVALFWIILILSYVLKKPFTWLAAKVSTCIAALKDACSIIGEIRFFVLRGRLTVRASTYLMALSQPNSTPEIANKLASSIDTYAAKQLLSKTRYHLDEVFNGNRLALISAARLKGFIG